MSADDTGAPGPLEPEPGGSGRYGSVDGTDVRTVGVAIPIPEPYGPLLQAKRAEFNDPLADSIPAHVTLLGPTEIHRTSFPAFVDHLTGVASEVKPFAMVLRGTGTFRPLSDVVFVQVAQGISGCERLEELIRSGPYACALAFPYHPHVTVAHDVDPADLDRAFEDLAHYHAAFEVDAIWLFEQDISGAWSPLQPFALTGPPGLG
ncbi:MAG: 2'-5' RNA ligase family protein [Candidatus Phosphoribacter sp.]